MNTKAEKIDNGFFASCPTGLEQTLASEVKKLTTSNVHVVKGGVHFDCPTSTALELILSSRIASRIFKKLYQFSIRTEKDIYFYGKEIQWNKIFNLEQTFKISVIQGKSPNGKNRSRFKSPLFLSQTLKDAIVDRFREDEKNERPNIDRDEADFSIFVRVEPTDNEGSKKENVTILADMTGSPLSQRGYRDTNFSAPLKENLAAGIVMLSGYTGEQALVDPMCGSGTIIIESLLIKGDIPPSYIGVDEVLNNNATGYWDFMKHLYYTEDKDAVHRFNKLLNTYYEKSKAGFAKLRSQEINTFAFDIQKYAFNASMYNLRASNLEEFVKLEIQDATSLKSPVESGLLITNPPYGERIGSEDNLEELYYDLGENMKQSF